MALSALLLSVAALGLAVQLVTARITLDALVASYKLVPGSSEGINSSCPPILTTSAFLFDQLVDKDFVGFKYWNIRIPFRSQTVNGTACSVGGATFAVESDHPSVSDGPALIKEWATAHGSQNRSWMATTDLVSAASKIPFIYGYDYTSRSCGGFSISAGTSYLYLEAPKDIALDAGIALKKSGKYLLTTGGKDGCVYSIGNATGGVPKSDPSRAPGFDISKPKATQGPIEEPVPQDAPTTDNSSDAGTGNVFDGSNGDGAAQTAGKCFPGDATVRLESGATKTMRDVTIGDRVHVGAGEYSDVFMFSHVVASTINMFIELVTNSGDKLALTPGHYLYVNGALASSETVVVGDTVELGDGAEATVESVSVVTKRGLFNPHTLHGDIVVDNIRTSTYTTAVQPAIAHSILLAPARAFYNAGLGSLLIGLLDSGADALAQCVPSGARVVI
jgi:Hint module